MNWLKRIERARLNNGFTVADKRKARDWFSCACGELDYRIRRTPKGEPHDNELNYHGLRFSEQVNEDDVEQAWDTLCSIERRERELLGKIKPSKEIRK